jgi:hypothetical protein
MPKLPQVLDLTHLSSEFEEPSMSTTLKEKKLQDAITTVSEARLRAIVAKLARSLPAAERILFAELVTTKPRQGKTQRVIQRWEECVNCGTEFDMSQGRESGECSYHSGE